MGGVAVVRAPMRERLAGSGGRPPMSRGEMRLLEGPGGGPARVSEPKRQSGGGPARETETPAGSRHTQCPIVELLFVGFRLGGRTPSGPRSDLLLALVTVVSLMPSSGDRGPVTADRWRSRTGNRTPCGAPSSAAQVTESPAGRERISCSPSRLQRALDLSLEWQTNCGGLAGVPLG